MQNNDDSTTSEPPDPRWNRDLNDDIQHTPVSVSLTAFLLGIVVGMFGYMSLYVETSWKPLLAFVTSLGIFHFLEYLATALFNAKLLSWNSFLLNHSRGYHLALSLGTIEYLIERWLGWKIKYGWNMISLFGLCLVIIGQTLRTLAMFTARSSFTHQLQFVKRREHQLVTNGIYSIMRHPSYAGFWYWGVGTQLVLTNFIGALGYAIVLTKFFQNRIPPEEEALIKFFGRDYIVYKQQTKNFIPGVWS